MKVFPAFPNMFGLKQVVAQVCLFLVSVKMLNDVQDSVLCNLHTFTFICLSKIQKEYIYNIIIIEKG